MEEQKDLNLLNPNEFASQTPKSKFRIWLFFILFIVLFYAGCAAYRHFSLAAWPTDANSYDLKTLQPKNFGFFAAVKNFVFHGDNYLQGQSEDRVNILLLGIGGPGHDGAYLTDTNIILSIKPSTKEVAMISVPRDLGVNIDGHGIRKINSASAFGEAQTPGQGGEYARKIFEKTFNIPLPYYVRVDFKAFEELIDEVGGIVVDVPEAFTDSEYPGPNFTYQTISFNDGVQNMNGETALQYARSRHGNNSEGSDFARARRQQLILNSLKEKLLSFGTYTNPVRVQKMLTSLNTHVQTNLDFGQLMYLANLGKEASGKIKMLVLDNSPVGYLDSYIASGSGAYLLKPRTNDFSEINTAINEVFDAEKAKVAMPAPTENKPIFDSAKITVLNGTWRVGLAAKYQKMLQEKGFTILTASNSSKRPVATSTIYVINTNTPKNLLNDLQTATDALIASSTPDWVMEYNAGTIENSSSTIQYNNEADVILILGTDLDK